MFEVAQGLILGSHLFKIFEADLFFILSNIDVSNFADYNTPYISGNNVDDDIESPEEALFSLFKWFKHNLLKSNTIYL